MRLLSGRATDEKAGTSRPHRYVLIREGKFPQQIKVGRRSFWLESEIDQWIADRVRERDERIAAEREAQA